MASWPGRSPWLSSRWRAPRAFAGASSARIPRPSGPPSPPDPVRGSELPAALGPGAAPQKPGQALEVVALQQVDARGVDGLPDTLVVGQRPEAQAVASRVGTGHELLELAPLLLRLLA